MEISYNKLVVLTTDYDRKVQENNQDCACKRSLSECKDTDNTDK
ncbi:16170_t:CDS:1, partial [Dentiscutata erythropus]